MHDGENAMAKRTDWPARIAALALAGLVAAAPGMPQADVTARNDPEAIPDLRIARGHADIAEAWLIAPTARYDHFVQGSRYEPGGLRVRTRSGDIVTLRLDDAHVFEDRQPRLGDLDGDGRDEIVLVLTSVEKGASLAVFGLEGGRIVRKARTSYIGRPHRWLNPAGIADYDGDGRMEVALVRMPHLVKRLELWSLGSAGLVREAQVPDVANHRLGSVHTGMAASADFDGDGIADLAVPDGTRRAVRLIGFAGGTPHEIGRLALPAPADGDFTLKRQGAGWRLEMRLETGRTVRIAIPPTRSGAGGGS